MTLQHIAQLLNARVVARPDKLYREVTYAFASDLMSDVLTVESRKIILITGLANIQAVRTAEMSDVSCIILVRNKKATSEMIRLAEESAIVIMEFEGSMFKASGILYNAGIQPIY
ncbi:MAG: hypothetical protein HPY80_06665 [Bacteroidales bacterium]|jgi:hypothetical protein|nr:hypothetical protein [Chloroflexota bacterium]NPV36333.1 hypothetical protein [Bacteroidales bacterium]